MLPRRRLSKETCVQGLGRTALFVLVAKLVQDRRAADLADRSLVRRDEHALVPPESVAGAVGNGGAEWPQGARQPLLSRFLLEFLMRVEEAGQVGLGRRLLHWGCGYRAHRSGKDALHSPSRRCDQGRACSLRGVELHPLEVAGI